MDIMMVLIVTATIIFFVWLTLSLVTIFRSAKRADEEAEKIFREMLKEIEGLKETKGEVLNDK